MDSPLEQVPEARAKAIEALARLSPDEIEQVTETALHELRVRSEAAQSRTCAWRRALDERGAPDNGQA